MNHLYLMLADDVDVNDLVSAQKQFASTRLFEMLVIGGAITLAVVIAGTCAIYFSLKKKKRKHRRHRSHSHAQPGEHSDSESLSDGDESKPGSQPRRRMRRRMNPTLAQTRGLPPLRDKDTPLPPMP